MTTQIEGGVKVENGDFVAGDKVIHNFYRSADYQTLQTNLEKAQQRVKKYPDESEFWQELEIAQQQLEDFKRDVLKLAEDFNKIPINTERLRLAKQYFEEGKYHEARTILDAEFMLQDQNALLAKKQRLNTELAEVSNQLEDNANEWLLKARLTAIDYSLPDRIAQTCHCFELALKSARTAKNIFAYAYFLQQNNQFSSAKNFYREVLEICRQLAQANPNVYLPYVATTLNNLGLLVADDSSRRSEAEPLYHEALGIRRQLAQANPEVYLPDVAGTLNNLGLLVADDSSRRSEAEPLYREALGIYRQLAQANPKVYLPDVANTLAGFGIAYLTWEELENSLAYLQESAALFEPFAKQAPGVFGAKYEAILDIIAQIKPS